MGDAGGSSGKFILAKHSTGDKELWVITPDENLSITVDFDDVDHAEALELTEKMVRILNAHWDDGESGVSTLNQKARRQERK